MSLPLTPTTESEVADIVRDRAARGEPLSICGGNTRSGFGNPVRADTSLTTSDLSGIVSYNPSEMVLTAKSGTPVAEIEAALAEAGQMMAFEPVDHRALMGTDGEPTIGGLFAANVSGPRRFVAGAARDALLGVRFVNGRGEIVKAGGRVMKNVTGLDLVKLMAGSYGTLGIMTEVTFKVLPRPQAVETIIVDDLDDEQATSAMASAMALPVEVSGAAHLPPTVSWRYGEFGLSSGGATVLRLEGLQSSVEARAEKLVSAMAGLGALRRLNRDQSMALWQAIADVAPYADGSQKPVWRVSVAPTRGHQLVAALRLEAGIDAFYDWQGGLVWMRMEAGIEADLVRAGVRSVGGGHATLVRAAEGMRAGIAAFEPRDSAVAALEEAIRLKFDPAGIFNPGKMALKSGLVAA
ncbi:glycolate oxidase subunit GlcE [Rhizobium sp. NRK18]|uniref:glycolate oxidase subunit GlcE n=1 Tax=Rhizobium sp. NRK18 TaxID=2964667 RepID=UPI0021C3DDF5|nr:glycolate oxidase subunit GlcE [Rhizobium sp. NRK18]MCQ2005220.1 glycolate oxidase subunit GlcE [Rhizobium sp. NRK18]